MKRKESRILFYILLGWLILLIFPMMSPAVDGNIIRTQGLINPGGNFKGGYILINEMKVYINKTTQVMDHREIPVPITELKPKRWVYMEVKKNSNGNKITAKKIYLLPYYINPEERRKYSFMR